MMRKRHKLFTFIFSFLFFSLAAAFCARAEITPVQKILEDPERFESNTVEVKGEAIGEPLYAKGGSWVNILSEGSHMAVVVDKTQLDKIKYWGGYRQSGDIIIVEGKFFKECPLHHETHMHVYALEVIARGMPREDTVPTFKVQMAVILFIICLTIGLVHLIKSRYGTRS